MELRDSAGVILTESNLEVNSVIGLSSSAVSSGGVSTFKNVRVIRSGDYKLYFLSNNSAALQASTELFNINSTIKTVKIEPAVPTSSYTAYFIYSFKVDILGDGDVKYLEPCTITLALSDSTPINGYTPKLSVSEATATFSGIYFDASGSLIATATAEDPVEVSVSSSSLTITIENIKIKIISTITVKYI